MDGRKEWKTCEGEEKIVVVPAAIATVKEMRTSGKRVHLQCTREIRIQNSSSEESVTTKNSREEFSVIVYLSKNGPRTLAGEAQGQTDGRKQFGDMLTGRRGDTHSRGESL